MTTDRAPASLRRDLGLLDAVGIGLGAIIGAGLFVVTGVAAGVAGPAFLVGLVLAGLAAACNALSSAQLAAAFPVAGGTYEYGCRVLHPWLGFAAGWMFLVSKLAAGSTVALGFASYLAALAPAVPQRGAAVAAVLVLTAVNYLGIQRTARLNTVIVAITVAVLGCFVVGGLPLLQCAHFRPFAPAGPGAILEAAALLFFAFTGYARLATLGEEVHEPRRTIPRAILLALGLATVLYLAVAVVALGTIGAAEMAASSSPLARAAAAFSLPGAEWAVGLGAVTAMLGVLLSQQLGISRMVLAMARRRDLPGGLDHVHRTFAVPDRAILLTGGVMTVLVLVGTLEVVIQTAAFTILLYYSVTNAAALRLARADKLVRDWVPVLGLAGCLLLAGALPAATWVHGGLILTVGVLFRLGRQARAGGQAPS